MLHGALLYWAPVTEASVIEMGALVENGKALSDHDHIRPPRYLPTGPDSSVTAA